MSSTRPTRATLDEIPELDTSKAKVVGRGTGKSRRVTLRALRTALGKTQAEIARATETDQGDVSRLEARRGADVKLSTLVRYAAALGGSVEVLIVIGGRRYVIEV